VIVAVVGAGLSGLVAAGRLRDAGHDVIVLDKGRVPGGRLATDTVGAAALDSGAQFFTVRSEAFAALVDPWLRSGVAYEWTRGFGDPPDGYPRYAVRGGMAALGAHLAAGLELRLATMCFAIRRAGGRWAVGIDDGTSVAADALVVTCPLPQSASLLMTAEVAVPEQLRRTDYHRVVAVLAALDGPGAVPDPGGVQDADATFSFVADNRRKGVSAAPAVTLHVNHDESMAHWEDPPDELRAWALAAAGPWFGTARVVAAKVRRWRFAGPQTIWPEACWTPEAGLPLALAGDAFAGPKVEGAALSGLAAAAAILA
jgi:predicted NAD/FAD-dependent oxidoreductase